MADYFAMLADDIAGRPYSNTEHNRLLQVVIDRPRGSIEHEYKNVSAVSLKLTLLGPWEGLLVGNGSERIKSISRWPSVGGSGEPHSAARCMRDLGCARIPQVRFSHL
ncbi:hypothetical protein [Bosea sp. 117]|uniref:hypothetical protein n=1 Tax=Bosea sp. 117 TaxID=1125973 RepID=UPI0018CC1C9D|nr:hypothetical protein [Bosea sp. 117]